MGLPVTDIATFFSGSWSIQRRILDLRQGQIGRLTGEAVFRPDGGNLHYEEVGQLCLGDYRGRTTQVYLWRLDSPSQAQIHFADGRPFHALDLSRGSAIVSHDCAPDLYCGKYNMYDAGLWSLAWRIEGPRKNQMIVTRFRRNPAA